jgi:hypothetical protein
LSSDGTILAIGAHLNDGNGNNSGHVRVYQWIAAPTTTTTTTAAPTTTTTTTTTSSPYPSSFLITGSNNYVFNGRYYLSGNNQFFNGVYPIYSNGTGASLYYSSNCGSYVVHLGNSNITCPQYAYQDGHFSFITQQQYNGNFSAGSQNQQGAVGSIIINQ